MELRQAFADVVTAGIAKGLSDGLRDGVEHGKAGLDLASLEVDELEQLKDAPIDCIMASLHLESDTGEDAPPEVRSLCPCAPVPLHFTTENTCLPGGLQIVLTDASTQTDLDKDNSPRRLARASSVPLF
ncbi:hypothetical protein Tco_0650548 [Tanacetum coccineum]